MYANTRAKTPFFDITPKMIFDIIPKMMVCDHQHTTMYVSVRERDVNVPAQHQLIVHIHPEKGYHWADRLDIHQILVHNLRMHAGATDLMLHASIEKWPRNGTHPQALMGYNLRMRATDLSYMQA